MENVIEQIDAIINGGFNHNLTENQMLSFDFETKKRMAWNLIVGMQFEHNFKNIDNSVFVKMPTKYTYDMLDNSDIIDSVLIELRAEHNNRQRQLSILTENYYYQQGKEIYEAKKRLGFSGQIEMDFRKLLGYVQGIGNWNEFNAAKVSEAIKELDNNCPRVDYGKNNCNTGNKNHKWSTKDDYIILEYSYVGEEQKNKILDFYTNEWQPTGRKINADSIRNEVTELENYSSSKAYSVEMIYWWD